MARDARRIPAAYVADTGLLTRWAVPSGVSEEDAGATSAADGTILPAETAVGRVAIRVDDLERVLPFYGEAIGCRVERDGTRARLSASDGRVLVEFEEVPGAPARPRAAAGLFHVAIRLPDRGSLADALARLGDAGVSLDGASDHLVSEALYLHDPAGNGLELYCDRPREEWPRREDGTVGMDTLRLDLGDLSAAGDGSAAGALPAGTDVGHVHLESSNLAASGEFYADALGLTQSTQDFPEARFLAAGDYHHHVAYNGWNRRTEPAGDHQGLRWFELVLPDEPARAATVSRLERGGFAVGEREGVPEATDPDGVGVVLAVRDS